MSAARTAAVQSGIAGRIERIARTAQPRSTAASNAACRTVSAAGESSTPAATGPSGVARPRTTTTGHAAWVATRRLTEPSGSPGKPRCPRWPTTMSSALSAMSRSRVAGWPMRASVLISVAGASSRARRRAALVTASAADHTASTYALPAASRDSAGSHSKAYAMCKGLARRCASRVAHSTGSQCAAAVPSVPTTMARSRTAASFRLSRISAASPARCRLREARCRLREARGAPE